MLAAAGLYSSSNSSSSLSISGSNGSGMSVSSGAGSGTEAATVGGAGKGDTEKTIDQLESLGNELVQEVQAGQEYISGLKREARSNDTIEGKTMKEGKQRGGSRGKKQT